jgi:hypothetical protein
MRVWIGRILAAVFFAALAAVIILALVRPPQQSVECLRSDGRCPRPVDRGSQVAIIVAASVVGGFVAGAGFAARRHRSRQLRSGLS